jgi:hypothetical protein
MAVPLAAWLRLATELALAMQLVFAGYQAT